MILHSQATANSEPRYTLVVYSENQWVDLSQADLPAFSHFLDASPDLSLAEDYLVVKFRAGPLARAFVRVRESWRAGLGRPLILSYSS
ncbi:hypothetical protein D3C71_1890650 [compost metagenome]